jgi:hypothetical protein
MIDALRDSVKKAYRTSIGKNRREVTTPALLPDLDVAKR